MRLGLGLGSWSAWRKRLEGKEAGIGTVSWRALARLRAHRCPVTWQAGGEQGCGRPGTSRPLAPLVRGPWPAPWTRRKALALCCAASDAMTLRAAQRCPLDTLTAGYTPPYSGCAGHPAPGGAGPGSQSRWPCPGPTAAMPGCFKGRPCLVDSESDRPNTRFHAALARGLLAGPSGSRPSMRCPCLAPRSPPGPGAMQNELGDSDSLQT